MHSQLDFVHLMNRSPRKAGTLPRARSGAVEGLRVGVSISTRAPGGSRGGGRGRGLLCGSGVSAWVCGSGRCVRGRGYSAAGGWCGRWVCGEPVKGVAGVGLCGASAAYCRSGWQWRQFFVAAGGEGPVSLADDRVPALCGEPVKGVAGVGLRGCTRGILSVGVAWWQFFVAAGEEGPVSYAGGPAADQMLGAGQIPTAL